MKLAKVIYLILFLVIILSCREEKAEHATEAGEDVEAVEAGEDVAAVEACRRLIQ